LIFIIFIIEGCALSKKKIYKEIGLNSQKELTRIQSFAFSSDKKYLALLHNNDKINIINIENLYMNEFDLYQPTKDDEKKEKEAKEKTTLWKSSDGNKKIQFVTHEETLNRKASVGVTFTYNSNFEISPPILTLFTLLIGYFILNSLIIGFNFLFLFFLVIR